jgi:mRNA-degrading endonuclease RelE of RelBE toxin-antitoxin system
MRGFRVTPHLELVLRKLFRRDRLLYGRVLGKMEEIVSCPDVGHYKNLKSPLGHLKRVHVGCFVLVFDFVVAEDCIVFVDLDHHDNVYKV